MPENEEMTTQDEKKFTFGFAVVVDTDGQVFIERNTQGLNIPVEREATLLEVRRYISEILMDLQAQSAAEYVGLRLSPLLTKPEESATPSV